MTLDELKKKPIDELFNYVENLESQRDDALTRIEGHDAAYLALKTENASLQALVDTLGGTETGKKMAMDKEKARLLSLKEETEKALLAMVEG
jgi:hypothetical protein